MSEQRDKNLWIFNAGNSFSGNPKWMFEYIIRHHKEIKPVWMCYNADTMNYVHKLGYEAELYHSSKKIHSKQRYSSQQPALFSYLRNYGKTFQRAVRH